MVRTLLVFDSFEGHAFKQLHLVTCLEKAGYLDGQSSDDGLCVDQGWVSEVVQAITSKDLCTGLEPDSLPELDSGVLLQQLRGQRAQGSKHGLHSGTHTA